ncbi:MAG: DUF389 domain-containing protein [Pirellulaceae bacterium]|nr:DUF389 domain-containing protein [Pirellulaceae bacterium]
MAIAVLISSPAEAERFTAIGLDLAARLDQSVVFLCVKPTGAAVEKKKTDTSKRKPPAENEGDSPKPESDSVFRESTSYVKSTREWIVKQIGTMTFGFVPTDVLEVPSGIEALRVWLTQNHESNQLGHFEIETLFIPMLRGAGLEHARAPKERLFEISQLETVFINVDQSCSARMPLNNIAVTGQTENDILNASRFARRFSSVRVRRLQSDTTEQAEDCVILGIPGKAQQTRIDNQPRWKALRKDENFPVSMILNPADSLGERINSAVDDKLRHWFRAYQLSREDRIKLSGKLEAGAASSPEFILFMGVATFLACIGLIQDSAAVIIGAMLVAPLMTPLLGAGLAMIYGNRPLFFKALRSITLGVLIAYVIGTIFGLFSLAVPDYLFAGNGLVLTNEMIARSQPNLLDPFIGFAAGLAGGFAIGRDGQIGTVAGVAIAAALVPPIASAGLETALALHCTILDGNFMTLIELVKRDPGSILARHDLLNDAPRATTHVHLISAPLILFALNACATIIGAFIGLRMVGMHRTSRARTSRNWVFTLLMLLISIILLLMLLPLIMF